ncbi:MAG: amidohydrolase family protein, partial [Dehalococcoidia bacterium]
MAYLGKVISGDCHIDIPWLPADLFTSKSPAHLRDRMPRVVETSEGSQWFTEDSLLGWVAGAGLGLRPGGWDPYVPGASRRLDAMEEKASFFSDGQKGMLHPTTPELRIKDQDTDGVSGEVIYGVLGLAGGLGPDEPDEVGMGGGDSPGPGYGISDPEVYTAAYDVYNDWLADFCKTNPDRFVGLACISGHDPQKAAKQLRHAAEIGLRGAELNVSTVSEPIYQQDWDVLWAAADECNMSIAFHTTGLNPRVPKKSDREKYKITFNAINLTQFQLSGAEYLSSISFSGACARFPNFKFVLGECGIGWIPYILHR